MLDMLSYAAGLAETYSRLPEQLERAEAQTAKEQEEAGQHV